MILKPIAPLIFPLQHLPDITTNNLLESWHKSLKKHYLRNERNVRPDYLMYMLMTEIDLDSRVTYFMIKNGLEIPKMSKSDKRRKKRADDLPEDVAEQMVRSELANGIVSNQTLTLKAP